MRNTVIRLAAGVALTLMVTAAGAAVYTPQQQLPAATIESFKANPSQLLEQFPQGGILTARVRDLGASDPTTIPALINLLKSSDQVNQMPAIAAGLAQLAKMAAARGDRDLGNDIAVAVAGMRAENPGIYNAYQIALGDAPIEATGGGGGGGAGSGGGGPTGTSGFAIGGSGGGATTFGALNYSTPTTSGGSTGFGGATTGASGAAGTVSATQ